CAGEADVLRARGRGGEDHGRRGVEVFTAMVFTDAEYVEPDPVGELNALEQLLKRAGGIRRGGDASALQVELRGEAVDADLHILKIRSRAPGRRGRERFDSFVIRPVPMGRAQPWGGGLTGGILETDTEVEKPRQRRELVCARERWMN